MCISDTLSPLFELLELQTFPYIFFRVEFKFNKFMMRFLSWFSFFVFPENIQTHQEQKKYREKCKISMHQKYETFSCWILGDFA